MSEAGGEGADAATPSAARRLHRPDYRKGLRRLAEGDTYGTLLILIVVAYAVMALVENTKWARAVTGALFGATLLLASTQLPATALADTYPRQLGVDAVHYVFRLRVGDDTVSLRMRSPTPLEPCCARATSCSAAANASNVRISPRWVIVCERSGS